MNKKILKFLNLIEEGRVYLNPITEPDKIYKVLCYSPYLRYVFLDINEKQVIPRFIDGPNDDSLIIT